MLCDANIVNVVQTYGGVEDAMKARNLTAPPAHLSNGLRFKYKIVPDGNAAPRQRLALQLAVNLFVIKQAPPYHEWYSQDLKAYFYNISVT